MPDLPEAQTPLEGSRRIALVPSLNTDPEQLYESAPCGYLSTTPDGLIIRVNQTFETLSGFDRDALVGAKRFIDLLSVGGRIYHETHYAPLLSMHGHVSAIAFEIVMAGGDRLPVLVNSVVETDAGGHPAVVHTAVFDATERRQYEQELLRATRRAEESEAHAQALARTLQETLIPPAVPVVAGLDLAAVYRPAGTGEEVGGDFYDIFEVDGDDWVITIGDVCGKGVDAAVVTALARYTLRAAGIRLTSPAAALAVLNNVMLHHGSDRFCTVAVVRLHREDRGWLATVSLGGHPQPLLGVPGEALTGFGQPGSLVGAFGEVEFTDESIFLKAGDAFVLYTDGVTEARRGRAFYGDERLRRVAGEPYDSAEAMSSSILHDVLSYESEDTTDDIAIVVVRIPELSDGDLAAPLI